MPAAEPMSSSQCVARLADDELIEAVERLLRQERRLSAALLVHLGEVDARGAFRQLAYSSMHDYCVRALHLSDAEAFLRIGAARLGRQFPRVVQMLGQGELHLSAIKLLAPVLNHDNCEQLLCAARFKSKRDVELLVAQHAPKPDVPSVIRKLPQPSRVPERVPEPQISPSAVVSTAESESRGIPVQAQPVSSHECQPASVLPRTPSNPVLSPLAPSRYKLQLTAGQQLHDKLRQAQDLLRHELPNGDVAQVLERALDLLIAQRMKRRFGQSEKPRAAAHDRTPKSGSRHVPHAVRRAVLARDGARCSFVSTDGKRCEQRGGLELHHEEPFGRGGPATVANIRVLCKAHNSLLAERDYGADFIQRRIERARDERAAPPLATGPRGDTR